MKTIAYTALALVIVGGGIVAYKATRPEPAAKKPTLAEVARKDRGSADAIYGTPKAKEAYSDFIARWKENRDKKVQDEVGSARLHLAYMQAKEKDFKSARATFQETVTEYKGTGSMASDFGGIKDQAQYQAAVCLNAEGKTKEYRAALVEFIKTQPLSPLVHAAYKRIVKVDGKSTTEVEHLIQTAIDAQEKKIRFEMSVCGPKALAYVLKLEGKGDFDYKVLARECGTTDQGTTMDGLRSASRKHGLIYFGLKVAKDDLAKIETPAILYSGEHYLVVTKASSDALTAYDPITEREEKLPLTKITDPGFNAILLVKSAPSAEAK